LIPTAAAARLSAEPRARTPARSLTPRETTPASPRAPGASGGLSLLGLRPPAVRTEALVAARLEVERRHAELGCQCPQRLLARIPHAGLDPADVRVADARLGQFALREPALLP